MAWFNSSLLASRLAILAEHSGTVMIKTRAEYERGMSVTALMAEWISSVDFPQPRSLVPPRKTTQSYGKCFVNR